MGWLWGNDDQESSTAKRASDPLANLDPSLRDFLRKESPIRYNTSNPPAAPPVPAATTEPVQSNISERLPVSEKTEQSLVPKESLFQDGRYAHLWKNYVPLKDIEFENKSDADKINDILEGYKSRRAEIGRAAIENCAMEQWDVNECFRSGDIKDRLMLCSKQNQTMARCYAMQSRFLMALGYLNAVDRSAEVDERIQMHADTLYHRMLDQEAQVDHAKSEGLPIPTFPPLMSNSNSEKSSVPHSHVLSTRNIVTETSAKNTTNSKQISENERALMAGMDAKSGKSLEERLSKMGATERELEVEAIRAEVKAGEHVAYGLGGIFAKQDAEKKARKEAGKETMTEYLSSLFR